MITQQTFPNLKFKDLNKTNIQLKAYNAWMEAGYNGIIDASTGIGKSMLGLMAISHLNGQGRTLIIVPTTQLMLQWKTEIQVQMGDVKIGLLSGKHNPDWTGDDIIIAVVNSMRINIEYIFLFDLLVVDEIHKLLSKKNYSILIEIFKLRIMCNNKRFIGLTATLTRPDGRHNLLFNNSLVVFKYSQGAAIKDNVLAQFKLINKKVIMLPREQAIYDLHDNFVKDNFKLFGNDFNAVRKVSKDIYNPKNLISLQLLRAFQKRKQVVCEARSKIVVATDLIKENHNSNKIIVFCETINTAEAIHRELDGTNIDTGIFHCKLKSQEKSDMFKRFQYNKIRVLIAVKALDEGINVPDCDVAIIVAGSSTQRQQIQRIGRLLRTSEGKDYATVIQLYIPNTIDERWLRSRDSSLKKNALEVVWE